VDREIEEKLLALNQGFYSQFATAFAESRPASDPALARILPHIPERARVLDLGCGNGRLACLLEHERPGCTYVGVDSVPELLAVARSRAQGLSRTDASFRLLDLAEPGWAARLPVGEFDCVLALALLHHVPGRERRASLLGEARTLLGCRAAVVISVWQFLDSARMRRKIRPWPEAGIASEQVDEGDYLLDWKKGGSGLRYCHLVDEEELNRLAAEAGLGVEEVFRAGGREGNLSLFGVLRARDRAGPAKAT
jgi:SAM-dependent methyltransferase